MQSTLKHLKSILCNKRTLFTIISILLGTLFGFLMIDDIEIYIEGSIFLVYPIFIFILLCVVNILFERKGFDIYIFPLLVFTSYIPINLLAGVYLDFNNKVSYYSSYPRYWILPYYLLFLIILYLFAKLIDALLNNKYSKAIYIITDILSLAAFPLLAVATYFVSPH